MKQSAHFHVFLHKTAVQRAVVLCKLDSLSSHGWYNLSACEFPMPLLLSTSSPREGGIIFVQLYV